MVEKLLPSPKVTSSNNEHIKPEATPADSEQMKPEAISPDNESIDLDGMSFMEFLDYAVANRLRIFHKNVINKFKIGSKVLIVVSNAQVASSKMIPTDSNFLMGPNTTTYIEFLAPIARKLTLYCTDFSSSELKEIFKSMNKHLSGSLGVANFVDCSEDEINMLEGTFESVSWIALTESRFEGNKKCHLNKVFPNTNVMRLELNNGVDTVCIEDNFPKLTIFEYHGEFSNQNANIHEFLKLNGQLESLSIYDRLSDDFFQVVSESLPNLEYFHLGAINPNLFMKNSFQKADLKNVELLTISTDFVSHSDPEELPFTVNELRSLYLTRSDINDRWIDIIVQQKKLEHLSIKNGALTYEQWQTITNELPQLSSVVAVWNDENVEGIFYLIKNNVNLKEINCRGMNMRENVRLRRDVRKAIDSTKWQMLPKSDEPDITLLRVSQLQH